MGKHPVGACSRVDLDGEPPVWRIYGHVDDAEAKRIAEADEGDSVAIASVTRVWAGVVPCRRSECPCDGEGHFAARPGPGRGSSPYTILTGMVS